MIAREKFCLRGTDGVYRPRTQPHRRDRNGGGMAKKAIQEGRKCTIQRQSPHELCVHTESSNARRPTQFASPSPAPKEKQKGPLQAPKGSRALSNGEGRPTYWSDGAGGKVPRRGARTQKAKQKIITPAPLPLPPQPYPSPNKARLENENKGGGKKSPSRESNHRS